MPLSDDARRFAGIPFLANLDGPALEALASASETRIVRRGEALFRRGESGDCGFVLVTGGLRLADDDGDEAVVAQPGSLIGEMALLVPSERRSTATAIEPSAVLVIPRDVFIRTLRDHPSSAVRLRDYCATRLTAFTDELGAAIRSLPGDDAQPSGDAPGA